VVLAVVLAALWGLGAGVVGAFVAPAVVRLGGAALPVGLVLALAAVVGAVVAGARTVQAQGAGAPLTGGRDLTRRLGAVAACVGWVAGVFVLSQRTAVGDLVVPGDTAGYAFLLGGMLTAGLSAAVVGRTAPASGRPAGRR
jgi:hypothetical protein